jgi:succinate dehydrogenase/fumarate reductase flavoprotein subunit
MQKNVGLPYRCMVPAKLDGLLAAGRCFSSDQAANTMFNVIPHCIIMGQAAGTAAALAVKNKVQPRKVDVSILQKRLVSQGVALP